MLPRSTEDGTPAKGEANLQGTDDQLVGTIVDALVSKVKQCWTVPPGAREANMIDPHCISRSIRMAPSLVRRRCRTPAADPIFDATARSAVAALMQCQAYDSAAGPL